MNINELYLKTIFCCIAYDGDIASEEVQLLNSVAKDSVMFREIDVQSTINRYINAINKEGVAFLASYLKEITDANLTDDQALTLISLAIKAIEADNNIEYSEISFFKKIRKRLSITDNTILEALPDIEDYLLPDIDVPDDLDWTVRFDGIVITQ